MKILLIHERIMATSCIIYFVVGIVAGGAIGLLTGRAEPKMATATTTESSTIFLSGSDKDKKKN